MKYIIYIMYISVFLLQLSLMLSCSYDINNYRQLVDAVPSNFFNKNIIKEVDRLKKIHDQNNLLNTSNFPQSDGYNPFVTKQINVEKPDNGGSIRLSIQYEPKFLSIYLDGSYYTKYITRYIYDTLITRNLETFQFQPSLAYNWKSFDILWIKAKENKDEEGDYYICKILENEIKYDQNGSLNSINVIYNGERKSFNKDQLFLKKSKDGLYQRYYDKDVVYDFTIKTDILWHDGAKFSIDDVLYTFDLIFKSKIPSVAKIKSEIGSIIKYEQFDKNTIRIIYSEQYYNILLPLSGIQILPKHILMNNDLKIDSPEYRKYFEDHYIQKSPIGTGPYYVPSKYISLADNNTSDGWIKNVYVKLIKNPKYFREDKAGNLDSIIFYFVTGKNASSRALSYLIKENNIDFASYLGSNEIFRDSNTENVILKYVKAFYYLPGYSFIAINLRKPYFSDISVRKALTYLTDREAVVKNSSYGVGMLISGDQYILGPAYNNEIKPLPYDQKMGVSLLNEAGWIDTDGDGIRDKDGIPFEIKILIPEGGSIYYSQSILLAEELKYIGIKLIVKTVPFKLISNYLNNYSFDLIALSNTVDVEEDTFGTWHSSQGNNGGANYSGLNDSDIDIMINNIRREIIPEKRKALFYKLHEKINDLQPYIFMSCLPYRSMYDVKYRNVKFYGIMPGWDLTEWYIPKKLQ